MSALRFAKLTSATFVLAACMLLLRFAAAQSPQRTLTGIVIDQQHEPLRGAVVQIEDENTHAIASFLTDRSGHYHFLRLNSSDDYSFWATYRGHRSKKKRMSMFNSKLQPDVTLVIKLD